MTKKAREPWELIPDESTSRLVFVYDTVLSEMRMHTRAPQRDSLLIQWVARLDRARDEFVISRLLAGDDARK
jgi:hypothetical protein